MKVCKCLPLGALLLVMWFLFFCPSLFAQGAGKVYFESLSQQLDARNKTVQMEGDAVIRNDSMELRAKSVTLSFRSGQENKSQEDKSTSTQNVESLLAKENVRIVREGLLSEGSEALYTASKDSVLLKGGPAKVTGTDYHVTGDEILYEGKPEKMDVKGSKKTPSSFYHANKGNPIIIHSDSQKWNTEKGEVLFSGNIQAKTETRTLEATELLVNYRQNAGKGSAAAGKTGTRNVAIDSITATGNVRITDTEGTGRGDKAVFTGNNETVTLTGNPAEITSRGNIVQGPQIRMNQKTGEMEISGGASARIIPQEKKTEEKK